MKPSYSLSALKCQRVIWMRENSKKIQEIFKSCHFLEDLGMEGLQKDERPFQYYKEVIIILEVRETGGS